MFSQEEVKQWLYSIRHMQKMRRFHLNEIANIKDDCDRLREGKASVLQLVPAKSSTLSNPTEQNATKIVDEYGRKMDYHIIEIDSIDVSIQKAKDFLKELTDRGQLRIEEFECLYYFYFEGMSNEETAIATYYSEQSVYLFKNSAIKKLTKVERLESLEEIRGLDVVL